MLVRTTPFYPRLAELNQTGLWTHWQGYLSALRYDVSAKHEYFGIRTAAGFFDTSPLHKYRIRGPDAERFLGGVMARDVRRCRPGRAQYTVWCDDQGYVLEDGVLFRPAEDEFLLTTARANLGYLSDLVGPLRVDVEDCSDSLGVLAVQGPRSREILAALAPEVSALPYFALTPATVAGAPVTISRTGYTGDLGYEVFVGADAALGVLDAVMAAGEGTGLRPFGEEALSMARVEAGMVLLDVDFSSSRLADNDQQRVTPVELGLSWMLRGIEDDDRPFVGRRAIRRELAAGTSRWATVGLVVDWREWDAVHLAAGIDPPKDATPLPWESMLYDDTGARVGHATSLMYSPVLQRHIAMARVRPDLAVAGTAVHVELTVDHCHRTVAAEVARLPLFNPPRKTA